jgi:hypothetical protein
MAASVMNVLRAKDFLNAQFEFINLSIDNTNPLAPRLKRAASGPAFIVLHLPPQHIVEEAVGNNRDKTPPYEAFLSCPTRLSFQLSDLVSDLPLTIESVLAAIAGSIVAEAPAAGSPATVIEFPAGLLLAPQAPARLTHQSVETTSSKNWIGLWHTRLGGAALDTTHATRFQVLPNPLDSDRFRYLH